MDDSNPQKAPKLAVTFVLITRDLVGVKNSSKVHYKVKKMLCTDYVISFARFREDH